MRALTNFMVTHVTEAAVVIRNLVKTFGDHTALDGISLEVPKGSVYGFIGANGAGKTTTIRILLGLAKSTSGSVTVLGTARGELPTKPIEGVAYLPDVPSVYPWLSAMEAMTMLAGFSGVIEDIARDRSNDLLALVGLDRANGRVGSFSRGMKQRLGIAAALVSAPQLLVLDEPTSALDPLGRRDVMNLLKDLRGRTTVLFSSHLLGDVEEVCTHVGMIHAGQMIAQGTVDDVLSMSNAEPQYSLRFSAAQLDSVRNVVKNAGLERTEIVEQKPSLQQVYEQKTERKNR